MITISRQGDCFVARDQSDQLASCHFAIQGDTVVLDALEYQDLPVIDGVLRACLANCLDRDISFYRPGDECCRQTIAALGYPPAAGGAYSVPGLFMVKKCGGK